MPWNPSLAGVRALAILMVMGFHLGLPLPSGGPVGVTVFFVLSGFLITSLLITEWTATGRVDLRAFFLRRARRLLPALVVAVSVIALISVAAGQADAVIGDSLLTLMYVSNWARVDGDLMGIWNHAWSLAIEAQFYVIWPVAFLALAMTARPASRMFIAILIGAAAASAAFRFALILNGATDGRVYFGSDTRAEALLAGCALGCLLARKPSAWVPAWAWPMAPISLILLAFVPDLDWPWPGANYSLVTLATCLLIAGACNPCRSWSGLRSRPMVWIGERSYSLYLWHVPVAVSLGGIDIAASPIARTALVALVSVVVAVISYEFVEQPFRVRRRTRTGAASGSGRWVPQRPSGLPAVPGPAVPS